MTQFDLFGEWPEGSSPEELSRVRILAGATGTLTGIEPQYGSCDVSLDDDPFGYPICLRTEYVRILGESEEER